MPPRPLTPTYRINLTTNGGAQINYTTKLNYQLGPNQDEFIFTRVNGLPQYDFSWTELRISIPLNSELFQLMSSSQGYTPTEFVEHLRFYDTGRNVSVEDKDDFEVALHFEEIEPHDDVVDVCFVPTYVDSVRGFKGFENALENLGFFAANSAEDPIGDLIVTA